jgi:glycine cleavage system H protein
VIAINDVLEDSPETINGDPYQLGWFFRLQPSDPAELDSLLDADAYQELCDDE